MAEIKSFEDIIAWQKAKDLTLQIYKVFNSSRDFAFRDQIQRAAVSVMNNIAEGYERKGDKQLKHFLFIAKGSVGEVRSMIVLAKNLRYINQTQFTDLHTSSIEIAKILSGFIKKLD